MYPLTDAEKKVFTDGYPQTVSITVTPLSGEAFTITEDDLVQGGLTVNRYTASGREIQIGCCSAAELTLRLNNRTGKFSDKVFQGARLYVTVSATDGVNSPIVPLGYFTVDNAPRMLSTITLTALDSMVKFDKLVEVDMSGFAAYVALQRCCQECNVTLGTTVYSSIPNYGYMITEIPDDPDLTYRQMLIWLCQIMGVNAYMDWNDELQLAFYGGGTVTLSPSNRMMSDLHENQITLTGIDIEVGETVGSAGSDGYKIAITGNRLIAESAAETLATNIWTAIGGFTYHPFTAKTLPMPWVWCGDTVSYAYNDPTMAKVGIAKVGLAKVGRTTAPTYVSVVTEVTFTVNKATALKATGESAVEKGYASLGTLTPQQKTIIEGLKTIVNEVQGSVGSVGQAMLHINDLAANTLGFYTTEDPQPDGSTIIYWHNKPTLAESNIIFKIGASGFFVSQDGGESYTRGFDDDGNAVVNILSAIGINANWLNIDDVIDRINNDGTHTINGTHVSIDGNGLSSVVQQIRDDVDAISDDLGNYSTLEQTADSVRIAIGNFSSTLTDQGVYEVTQNVSSYFSFEGDGLYVGSPGSAFKTRTSSDAFDILQGGSPIASFSALGTTTPAINLTDGLYLPPLQLNAYAHGWLITKSIVEPEEEDAA